MAGYSPLKITGMQTGLVQQREEFILPDDAYPNLQNAYVWRERILRKKGYELLGRLQRSIAVANVLDGAGQINLIVAFGLGPNASIVPGSLSITIGPRTYTDPSMNGNIIRTASGTTVFGTINYSTGLITIAIAAGLAFAGTVQYYPGLPVMGIRTRELTSNSNDETVFFDQVYAYVYDQALVSFKEFIPGTTWNASNQPVSGTDFFWSTNYWVSSLTLPGTAIPFFSAPVNRKLFWVTNNTGAQGATADPIRITDGSTWVDFVPPNFGQIDAAIPNPNFLVGCLSLLPFRGRMLAFNTYEGASLAQGINYSNRIRWSTIGNPFIPFSAGPPARGSWRDDIRGQGGFLDIPTSEDIVSVGFVRDNLVIYCERSTWQLRYTGRSIAPFQIEKVNSELGGEGPFSAVQFDTSLVGIGDKGIVECDSYKSERIDIKIPDFVFEFQNENNGPYRVHGVRNFINRLAFWTVPLADQYQETLATADKIFPNTRLVYNYENDSWAIFNDSLTAMGTYQPQSSRTWLNTKIPWIRCDFSWIGSTTKGVPSIVGGNQQGFIEYLDELTTNDVSLYISAITPNTTTPTVITSPNHNMNTGFVIEISGIPIGTPYAASLNSPKAGLITNITQANPAQVTSAAHSLETGDQVGIDGVVGMTEVNGLTQVPRVVFTITVVDANNFTLDSIDSTAYTPYISGGTWTSEKSNVFGIVVTGPNTFELWKYNADSGKFSDSQLDIPAGDYVGAGLINIRENFSILSKKFNFLDEGQSIQFGYLDILMAATERGEPGAISLNVYLNYDGDSVSNTRPQNEINDYSPVSNPDTFFNSVIPTTQSNLSGIEGSKFWQRVYCPSSANFLTFEYVFSNAQMAGEEQTKQVQIDAQVLWIRKGGRMVEV